MSGVSRGSILSSRGRVSIWRVPNFLLEPRGSFLPSRDRRVDQLSKYRSVCGGIIVIGMIINYSGLAHTGFGWSGTETAVGTVYNVKTPEGAWFAGVFVTFLIAAFVVPVVAGALVLTAERGYRLATLWQMRWVAISFFACCVFWGAVSLILDGAIRMITPLAKSNNVLTLIAAAVLSLVFLVLGIVWLVKSLHLITAGLFRADDAHPLLGPISVIPIAWAAAIILYLSGVDGGLQGVPDLVAKVTAFGGAIAVTGLSFVTICRLRHSPYWPFRRGPVCD